MRPCVATCLILSTIFTCFTAFAQMPDDVSPTDLRVVDVAIFKHGYGFVMAEGQAKTKDGWTVFDELPQASLGTFWLYSPKEGVSVDRAIAEVRDLKTKRDVDDLSGLVAANVGSKASVVVSGSGNEIRALRGTLQAPIYTDKPVYGQPPPTPLDDASVLASIPPRPTQQPKTLSHIMLKTDQGEMAIPIGNVRNITFEREASRQEEVTRPEQMLAARLVRDGKTITGDAPVGMAYLAKGLRWIPNYRVEITGEGQARLQLQGNVINDVVDLKDSRLHLVVGVPHFIQQDVISPMSLQVTWTRLSSYFADYQARSRDMYSNAMMSQMASSGMGGGAGMPGMAEPAGPAGPPAPEGIAVTPVTGAGVEDLYFYKVSDLTLKRGSRATVAILEEQIKYEDVYLWDMLDEGDFYVRRWSRYYYRNAQQSPQSPEQRAMERERLNPKVWHALRVKNETKAPWTTAPALVVKDWQPVSQSMVLYTPPGGQVDIQTTQAPDIFTERTDTEVARKENARIINSAQFDLLTVRGDLKAVNHKQEAIRLIITRQFDGNLSEASDGGTAVRVPYSDVGLNPLTKVTWDLKLAPAEEKTVTFTYTVLVYASG